MRSRSFVLLLALLGGACGSSDHRASCGITSLAGSTLLLNEFSVPQATLGAPPAQLPERLVARLVAGPAYPAVVGRSGREWVIGVEGTPPAGVKPAFGVLVLDPYGKAKGVMLYESEIVHGAPPIGTVSIAGQSIPLIGIQVDPTKIEDPRCPVFPDSVLG